MKLVMMASIFCVSAGSKPG